MINLNVVKRKWNVARKKRNAAKRQKVRLAAQLQKPAKTDLAVKTGFVLRVM
ncbi:hypothetical protein MYP_3596 [Sporocytophaga myxococcoides]|uniref:Uncharacterized protein n=1 Tax=Sporocytophaga myxococcoides TaxID=153721 RepID=A0A098LJ09_9BACT|nr:hypothetical protein MYP_3596 [Sporocytophaga myxococcoides]